MIAIESFGIRQGAFALRDVSFRSLLRCYAVLMGRTGSGKTTVLEAIAGLRPVREGRILLAGRDVTFDKPGGDIGDYRPRTARSLAR